MMEKLVDAVMRNLSKTSPTTSSAFTRNYIEQRIGMMFPAFNTPDHPPYSLMIEQAIAKLNEEGGSTEESISKCITLEYNSLPWAHASLLSHHLRKLRDSGEIVYTRDNRYMLPFDGKGSVPPASPKEKFKRGRGRKRRMHMQNKKLKREIEAEHKMKQRRTEIKADFDRGETSQLEVWIDLRDSELATADNAGVEGNDQGSVSQCPQYQCTRKASPAAEKIVYGNDEPMVEQVQVSDEQYTMAEQMPMEQELHDADHDELHEQRIQQHYVISAQQDQVEVQPVILEDTEQNLADSESRSRIMEELMPMEQEPRVADHDESDEQRIPQHGVILVQQDQVEAHPVSAEDTEQSPTDSESRSRIMEEQMPMEQEPHVADHDESGEQRMQQHDVILAQQGQVEAQPVSAEDTEQSLADSEPNHILLEVLCRQILMRQKEIGELVERLKQLTDSPENDVLPYEKLVEVLRRNREIELVLLEMRKSFSSSSLFNHILRKGKAGVPSKDPSTIGDGAAGEGFSLRRCQQQYNFIQATGIVSCAERPPLYPNSCHRQPDDAAKDSGDLSGGKQKQPELSNQQTQSHEKCIQPQRSGDKPCGSSLTGVVALPVPGNSEKISKQQRSHYRPGQLEGTEPRVLPPRGQFLGLNSRKNEVLPYVSIQERACHEKSVLQRNDCLEQGHKLSKLAKFQNGRDGSVKDSGVYAERIKEYPTVSNRLEDLNHDRSVAEPPEKRLELPIPEGAEELSEMELRQAATESMTKTMEGSFLAEQSYSGQQTTEQPPQNEPERDNTITSATNPGSPVSLTSGDLPSPKKRYKGCDMSNINLEYREKLRTRNLGTNPNPMNPCSEEVKEALPPPAVPVYPGMLREGKADAVTSENLSQFPVLKKRRGRPPKRLDETDPHQTHYYH